MASPTNSNHNPGTIAPAVVSDAEKVEQDQRLSRNALRILETIIKAMPKLAKNLKIKGEIQKVAHDINIAGINKFSAMILASYVIIKGEKERTVYFAILQPELHDRLKQILSNNRDLLNRLTSETLKIQFACPQIDKGFQFKPRKKGLFGREVYLEEFSLH